MRYICLLIFVLSSCVAQVDIASPTVTSDSVDDEWQTIEDGIQYQIFREEIVYFQAIRIDPQRYTFRSHYRPQAPRRVEQWSDALPDALAFINTNFFTVDNEILGLLISDGQSFGESYRNRGGTFYVADGEVGIVRNAPVPSLPTNTTQAVQAFPMLVIEGQAAYTNRSDTAISRRTVIAIDDTGYIIMMVTSGFGMSLPDLSEFLANSDLRITTALNLDGGGSTMLRLSPNDTNVVSLDPVPSVLGVYRRQPE